MFCLPLGHCLNSYTAAGKNMASFYPSEGDMLPPTYLLNQKHSSSELATDSGQPSVSLSYSNLLSCVSLSANRDEVFIPPPGGTQQIDRSMNIIAPRYTDGNSVVTDTGLLSNESMNSNGSEPIRQYHGLSLTLGSQEPPLIQLHSDLNQFTSSNYHPLLTSNVQPELQLSQNNGLIKNAQTQYLSFDFSGQSQDTVRFVSSLHHASGFTGSVGGSKYLKAAQDLLDELVSVHRAAPKRNFNSLGQDGSTERDVVSAEFQESSNNTSRDLSPSERNDLQNKVTKLLGMLDEVDRRYKQYCHQMQVVVSSFDIVAGRGAAHPYTALALRTISRQFRCLCVGIKKQIQAAQNVLGEHDVGPNGVGMLSRLRYVDQQLRQQKALQQFGVMRQPWRPQRGLPETAVSVLRAWLFEHFLHPYPKDSEKVVLARQTGLTRSQVANWFINARVRLWKPMIEEIYKEEFGEGVTEPKSSPENATTTQEISAFDDREEEFQGSLMSPASDGNHHLHSKDLAPDMITNSQANTSIATLTYDNKSFSGNEVNFGLMHMQQGKQIANAVGHSMFPDHNAPINMTADANIAAAADKHHDLITNVTSMNQVSLALGLQNSDKDRKSLPDETQQKGFDSSSTSMPLDKLDYYYVDPVSNQHRFANTHLLSDFVV